jgi:hypothetical protein
MPSRKKSRSRTTRKKWRELAPMTKSSRKKMPRKCFLLPKERKYPVCRKGSTRVSCQGTRAAEFRARLNRRPDLVAKAKRKRCSKP